jgi:type IV secretory pathway TrbL component
MSLNLILIIAALIVSWLVFTALLNVLKTTLKTAISIAAIVLALQLVFGIGPQQLWQQIIELPQTFLQPASGK